MPRFAANLTLLYNEHPFTERFAAAARAGFNGCRVPVPLRLRQAPARRSCCNGTSSIQVLHNLPAGDWASGERGIGCHPDRVGEFQDGVGKAIDYATALGCKQVNCLAGLAPAGVTPERLRDDLHLQPAIRRAETQGSRASSC